MGRTFVKKYIRGFYKAFIKYTKIFKRNISDFPPFYYGSALFSITHNTMEYILHYLQKNREFYDFIQNSYCIDEIVFQTIILNSELKNKIENDNKRFIDWSARKASPKIFTLEDFDRLVNSGKLFARKFDSNIDNKILNALENHIRK